MAEQISFEDYAFGRKKHITARDKFLTTADKCIPWDELCRLVLPYYFTGRKGRKPYSVETMLRMYFIREWYGFNDKQTEDAVYDSAAMRSFMKLDFTREKVPDATTLCKFRKLIASHRLGKILTQSVFDSFTSNGYTKTKNRYTELGLRKTSRKIK